MSDPQIELSGVVWDEIRNKFQSLSPCKFVPPTFEESGEAWLGFFECPSAKSQMLDQGLTEHQLDQIYQEACRWRDVGYPDPKAWHLSSLCLSELGLKD